VYIISLYSSLNTRTFCLFYILVLVPTASDIFLVAYEGEEVDQFFLEEQEEDEEDQRIAVKYLTDQAFLHHVTGEDVYRYTEPTIPATSASNRT
jgi:hypothetical protein